MPYPAMDASGCMLASMELGVRSVSWDMVKTELVVMVDTEQLYESTTEVWDTGQQAQRIKDASSDDNLIDRFTFFGWCTSSRGTNVEKDTTCWRVHADQEKVGHGGPYQQRGEHDHRGSVHGEHYH
jgi:hypothetical protein